MSSKLDIIVDGNKEKTKEKKKNPKKKLDNRF